ncbi:hypothetical protein JX360_07675 [Synechococcus bigranulatus str. 'Rupite']|uniref:Uncharacterized protein n=1 Tax=Thermostichus vulcanus str. 'Rupite' TaxID=2813851 RepID=A0ABT0CAK5_THEVL|nr:hypothetical protein [Thermostichus vulcanus]MCJ2542786.1 hypothetical protein [Thermostichus vulcanus str. 'Rupite']
MRQPKGEGHSGTTEKEHPDIKVNIVRDSTGVVTAKLLAEKDNPQADAVWGLAATSLLVADQQGLLEPYAPAGLDRILPEFRDSQNPPHWVGIDTYPASHNELPLQKQGRGSPPTAPLPSQWV